jgi:hypothetical protein
MSAKPAAMTGSSAAAPLAHFRPHHAPMTPPSAPAPPPPASGQRDYRKGNWTLQETLVLITAKRLDDDRRAGGAAPGSPATATPRSAEQRWKWVENHCWQHGCLRSQNQCNDKWDNLLRDYKKVRDYEARAAHHRPYWSMERHERKDSGLPTNLAPDVYNALSDVLARRAARRGGGAAIAGNPPPPPLALPPPSPRKPLLAHPRPPPPPPLLPMPPATTSVSGMVGAAQRPYLIQQAVTSIYLSIPYTNLLFRFFN